MGADFLVSPIISDELIRYAKDEEVVWVPGCMTPTEIAKAESAGINLVKLFPGDVLGTSFVKSIKPLFPEMKYMVTGGVTLSESNLRSWFDAGANAVGVGSKLFSGEFVNSVNVSLNLNMSFNSLLNN